MLKITLQTIVSNDPSYYELLYYNDDEGGYVLISLIDINGPIKKYLEYVTLLKSIFNAEISINSLLVYCNDEGWIKELSMLIITNGLSNCELSIHHIPTKTRIGYIYTNWI